MAGSHAALNSCDQNNVLPCAKVENYTLVQIAPDPMGYKDKLLHFQVRDICSCTMFGASISAPGVYAFRDGTYLR